jgi:hypothetical protein
VFRSEHVLTCFYFPLLVNEFWYCGNIQIYLSQEKQLYVKVSDIMCNPEYNFISVLSLEQISLYLQ